MGDRRDVPALLSRASDVVQNAPLICPCPMDAPCIACQNASTDADFLTALALDVQRWQEAREAFKRLRQAPRLSAEEADRLLALAENLGTGEAEDPTVRMLARLRGEGGA